MLNRERPDGSHRLVFALHGIDVDLAIRPGTTYRKDCPTTQHIKLKGRNRRYPAESCCQKTKSEKLIRLGLGFDIKDGLRSGPLYGVVIIEDP